MAYNRCDTDFNLDKYLISFLQNCAFFAELSRHIHKVPSLGLPTAGVSFDVHSDEITLYWNPEWFNSLTSVEVQGILMHEMYHVVFGHITTRRKEPHVMWNIATDLAINSLIYSQKKSEDADPLPPGILLPGRWPTGEEGRELSDEEKKASKLGALIASFPLLKPSEWYFMKLREAAEEDKKSGGSGMSFGDDSWIKSIDDHTSWDDVPEELREYVEQRVKAAVEKSARVADQSSTGWGNIPADIVADVRRWVSSEVDWRKVLRQFIGNIERGARTNSIKRINKRFPYVHPGTKRGYVAKLLVSIDQSGSVGDDMLSEFFAELGTLTKKVSVTVLPFDCSANENDMFEWRKGQKPHLKRVKCGGTNFDAPTAVFNDPKNRGRWNGLLVLTDGQAPAPIACRGKRAWVLGRGCSLAFTSNELQIFVQKERPMTGSWR